VSNAIADINQNATPNAYRKVAYRLLDERWTLYTGNNRGFHTNPRYDVMRHMIAGQNLSMTVCRQSVVSDWAHVFVSDKIGDDSYVSNRSKERAYFPPLYLYPDASNQTDAFATKHRTINYDPKLYGALCRAAGIDPLDQAGPDDDFRASTGDARPSEIKVFDYIYGVLHSPDYRATYAEFLKIDFPRIPYPASPEVFAHISDKGEALRRVHLMEAPALGEMPYVFDGEGDDVVASGYPKFEGGRVLINEDQYFEGVPQIAWGFHIGGYQPAQKWLKDRRGRTLSWDDIGHYQKIIKVLTETDRIMGEIELPLDTAE